MIYATEQQAVVTAVLVVVVALVSLFTGILWGHKRGMAEAAEERRWAREQSRARRVHPVYRNPFQVQHEKWLAHEQSALGVVSEWPAPDETVLLETRGFISANDGTQIERYTPVLEPTAVLSPGDMSVTGEIAAMTAEMEAFMAGLIGGTDDQLRGITR